MTVQTLEELQEGTEETPRGWKYFKLNVWNYLLYLFQFDNGVPKIGLIKYMIPKKTYKNKIRQKKKKQTNKNKKKKQQQQQKNNTTTTLLSHQIQRSQYRENLMTLLLEFLWLPVSLRRTANKKYLWIMKCFFLKITSKRRQREWTKQIPQTDKLSCVNNVTRMEVLLYP